MDLKCIKVFPVPINGGAYGNIISSRGRRQGGPLSPYLFILYTEVLSRLFETANANREFIRVQVAKGGTELTYAFFADDLVVFGRVGVQMARAIRKCLENYCTWTGQKVNVGKSAIYFSRITQRTKAI